ncbi:hypothetical protein MLD38_002943 [Melastoma candidum]|uniref:Uncharacterized protein n=1 Tax=Melastoma candidum TaxID=119954 RepID=A0ACB9S2B5_9MYRT|nr:hypothetical protein MLD38_002943 [Melastoma candidum]
MALCGAGFGCPVERFEGRHSLLGNLSTILVKPLSSLLYDKQLLKRTLRDAHRVRCFSAGESVREIQQKSSNQSPSLISIEDELGPVMRFKMSDFKVLNCVSVGLGGRADEVVFEAIVRDPLSPLYDTKVVLRRLISAQAKRRGKRAIEVLKKLVHRKVMYYSYSMEVHGFASSSSSRGFFTLVHGYNGSFSLRHWLQQSDWLPTLEAALALDEESVRRVGDDTIGGPAVSRQLRLTRILMRDLLIGVNYLHSHGLAHTELRLENVHICPVDRHIKVGILGNAADFSEDQGIVTVDGMDRREMMIAFDMRCVGFIMAKMVLRELMDPLVFSRFKSFFTKGNDPACLREYVVQVLNKSSPSANPGIQILDRNRGAGWNLLSLLLATKPSERIRCIATVWRHLGLTTHHPTVRVLIGNVYQHVTRPSGCKGNLSLSSEIAFKAMTGRKWLHDKSRVRGKLHVNSLFKLKAGRPFYLKEDPSGPILSSQSKYRSALHGKLAGGKYGKAIPYKELPLSLPVAKLI